MYHTGRNVSMLCLHRRDAETGPASTAAAPCAAAGAGADACAAAAAAEGAVAALAASLYAAVVVCSIQLR